MEGEDHYNVLARSDVSKPFRIFLIDDQRPLHVGNAPVPGELCGARTDEADGPQLDAHTEPPYVRPDICFLPIRSTAYGKSPEARQKVVERFLDPCTLLGRMG